MRTTTWAVRQQLASADVPLEAYRMGLLNISAFAVLIQPEVERLTCKTVQKNTIVVALSRLVKDLPTILPLKPYVTIEEISIKAPLADITYDRNEATLSQIQKYSGEIGLTKNHFFTITQGINEVTVIVSQSLVDQLMARISHKPKAVYYDLVGITMRFDERYVTSPNVIYSLLSRLASQRINLLEIVSTYTELTVFIAENEFDRAIKALNHLLIQIVTEKVT